MIDVTIIKIDTRDLNSKMIISGNNHNNHDMNDVTS